MTELWEYYGEPTNDELYAHSEMGNHQVGFRHKCPMCGKDNTEFLRHQYWMCHDCLIWFTTEDALGFYDVQAYEQDDRIPIELINYLEV